MKKNMLAFPQRGELKFHEMQGNRVSFEYTEWFSSKRLIIKTYKLVSNIFKAYKSNGLDVKIDVDSKAEFITVSGIVPRRVFGDLFTGEFLYWSSIGDIKLKELVVAVPAMLMGELGGKKK